MNIDKLKDEYEKQLPLYEKLAEQVTQKLTKRIAAKNIHIHSMRYRIKEFDSFYNKLILKKYSSPFRECTDIAGCRIVCLFQDQIQPILKIIEQQFDVIESFQKGKDDTTSFAYSSYHIVVKAKNSKNRVVCEIQLRTILQEAWAEIEHHVNYKTIGVDKELLRKVNSLAALFEIADDQFHQIHQEFTKLTKTPTTSTKEINSVLLYNFCKQEFSWAWKKPHLFKDLEDPISYDRLCIKLKDKRVNTLKDLKDIFEKQREDLEKDDLFHVKEVLSNPSQWPSLYARVKETNHFYTPLTTLGMLINSL